MDDVLKHQWPTQRRSLPGLRPSPSSEADGWGKAKMTVSDRKSRSGGWSTRQSVHRKWALAQRRSTKTNWTRKRSRAQENWGNEGPKAGMERKRMALPTWAICRAEVWDKAWRVPGATWLDLTMWLYIMWFCLLLTGLQELPTCSFVGACLHCSHGLHFTIFCCLLLIFNIPCVYSLPLQQHTVTSFAWALSSILSLCCSVRFRNMCICLGLCSLYKV